MAKELTQETLDQLADLLEIEEPSATAILQSLLTRLFTRAEKFEQAYFKADNYSEIASEALYGAAENVDRLQDEVRTANQRRADANAELVAVRMQRDEARAIARRYYRLSNQYFRLWMHG